MSQTITAPCATAVQLSGNNPEGLPILSVLVKRSYAIRPDGKCDLADDQEALHHEPVFDPTNPLILLHDFDVYPFKPTTDLIVKGRAYGQGKPWCEARVSVSGTAVKSILAFGKRDCIGSRTGSIFISPPDPFDKVPLCYVNAYGGHDQHAFEKYGNPMVKAVEGAFSPGTFDPVQTSPFVYPRNPAGTGFLVENTKDAVNQLRLPSLEDPLDPLTPERLVVGNPLQWTKMPLPQATDWVNYDWFPRMAYFGISPLAAAVDAPILETARGFAPANILEDRAPSAADAFRFCCGASLGLQLPYLKPDDPIELLNMHPKQAKYSFCLPAEKPKIWTDGRKGTLKEAEPVIQTVIVAPDYGLLTIIWRGAAQALRMYMPQELEKMPFKVEW